MLDSSGRKIEYLRISVTDRCNLRCCYCMPENGVEPLEHGDILSYEELLRLTGLLASLGIRKVRLTGGEPLVRRGLPSLVSGIKSITGIESVCLTTNGVLLAEQLPELASAGLDGVNISLDAACEEVFCKITHRSGIESVFRSIEAAAEMGLPVKINCVPMPENESQLIPLAERFLPREGFSLRFIELMPIGMGKNALGLSPDRVKNLLTERFGELYPLKGERLAGPCRYFGVSGMPGSLGFISAVSNCFCQSCNRVRLTSTGFLKTCLQFDRGAALKPMLGKTDEEILEAMKKAIFEKPAHHLFAGGEGEQLESHIMSQIGG